jgi:spermidine/putrescine transport system ATP-binding protein
MTASLLSVRNVSKRFGRNDALSDVSLEVEHGEFIALLGPSGCGKTTLLRCIAGFITPDVGSVLIAGEDVTADPPYRRPLNTVFQNYALFPHMSVLDNVAYGPRRHGASPGEASDKAREALELVGLEGLGERQPRQLSGGQQQRVALARAIVNRPKLLLLDEPLSALDLKLRKRMQIELKHLQEKLGIAFVFVTHDQEEAMTMADRVVVLNRGRIEQSGRGEEIYRSPATRFVADFIGEANMISCTPDGPNQLKPQIGSLSVVHDGVAAHRRYLGVLRPEHVELFGAADTPGFSTAAGIVEDVINVGSHTIVNVRVGDTLVASRRLGMIAEGLAPGANVVVGFQPRHLHVIAE